jgi:hypothetical protein
MDPEQVLRRGANSAFGIVTVDGKHYVHTFDISAIGASFIYKTPKSPSEIPEHK